MSKGDANNKVIHISIPQSLWAKLETTARNEGRSFNGHCRFILQQSEKTKGEPINET